MPIYLIRAGDGPVRMAYTAASSKVALRTMQRYHWETLRIIATLRSAPSRLPELAEQFSAQALGNGWFTWSDEMANLVKSKPRGPVRGRRVYTLEIEARIRQGGEMMGAIAKDYGLSRERVRQIAKRIGVTGRDLAKTLPPRPISATQRKKDAKVAAWERKRAELKSARAERVARAVALLDGGMPRKEIAWKMKLNVVEVGRLLIAGGRRGRPFVARKLDAPRPQKPPREKIQRPLTPQGVPEFHDTETVAAARRDWDEGLSAQQIADRLTSDARIITKNVIIGLAHRYDFPPRPSPKRRRKHPHDAPRLP
jgi:hypothetical protein